MQLELFNTVTRKVEAFQPMQPPKVGFYSCGPTVYSYAHIGNMRTYIFSDTLRRALELFNYDVNHVMNITDVGHLTDDADDGEDKVEKQARQQGLTAWDVAQKYTDAFFDHADKLNIKRPHVVCKATDHIPEQIALVQSLEERGYAYKTSDGVYFDTEKFSDYTKFARLNVEGMQEGHRVDLGEKRSKTDFALWKFSAPEDKRQMEWDSPWGRGFPGWHIECSAMSMRFLGEQFDIHTGGVDHIPVHHTNEIAQSECATGCTPFVRYWLHGEFLVVDDAPKMSKSLGNILTVDTLAENGVDPLAYRYLCLQSHYRKQLKFTDENMRGAAKAYSRLREQAYAVAKTPAAEQLGDLAQKYADDMRAALAHDLNAPQVVALVHQLLDDKNLQPGEQAALLPIGEAMVGLRLGEEPVAPTEDVPQEIQDLLQQRQDARARKDWAAADVARDAILAKGFEILDSKEGSSVRRRL